MDEQLNTSTINCTAKMEQKEFTKMNVLEQQDKSDDLLKIIRTDIFQVLDEKEIDEVFFNIFVFIHKNPYQDSKRSTVVSLS